MATFTLKMDERMETTLGELQASMNLKTKADVLRLGVGILRELRRRQEKEGPTADVALGILKDDEVVQKLLLVG